MLLIQDAQRRPNNADGPRRSPRLRQADKFEVLVAASEVEDTYTSWIADHLLHRDEVSS